MIEEIDNILDYLRKAGLNTINTNSPAWTELHKVESKKDSKIDNKHVDKSTQGVNSIDLEKNGQKMSVGKLVRHRTVPALGLGLVVAESKIHKGFWIVQWCDTRYYDVGQLGIDKDYLQIV